MGNGVDKESVREPLSRELVRFANDEDGDLGGVLEAVEAGSAVALDSSNFGKVMLYPSEDRGLVLTARDLVKLYGKDSLENAYVNGAMQGGWFRAVRKNKVVVGADLEVVVPIDSLGWHPWVGREPDYVSRMTHTILLKDIGNVMLASPPDGGSGPGFWTPEMVSFTRSAVEVTKKTSRNEWRGVLVAEPWEVDGWKRLAMKSNEPKVVLDEKHILNAGALYLRDYFVGPGVGRHREISHFGLPMSGMLGEKVDAWVGEYEKGGHFGFLEQAVIFAWWGEQLDRHEGNVVR